MTLKPFSLQLWEKKETGKQTNKQTPPTKQQCCPSQKHQCISKKMFLYFVFPCKFLPSKQTINFNPNIAIVVFKNIHKYTLHSHFVVILLSLCSIWKRGWERRKCKITLGRRENKQAGCSVSRDRHLPKVVRSD